MQTGGQTTAGIFRLLTRERRIGPISYGFSEGNGRKGKRIQVLSNIDFLIRDGYGLFFGSFFKYANVFFDLVYPYLAEA